MSEEVLTGGNVSGQVVRIGDTVRRQAGDWTPAVHALLDHLHAVGFRGAPRALGLDEQGREVLEYLPGAMAWPGWLDKLDDPAPLTAAGRLIREYHDAVAGFRPPPDARWQRIWPDHGDEIIAHHDLAPWNLVLGERPAFIDWDGAAPGTRLWDLAYAAHGFVPLATWVDPSVQRARRLRSFVDAYGLDEADRREFADMLAVPVRAMYDLLAHGHETGTQPWARLWDEGHGDTWRGDAEYLEARRETWLEALL